MGVLLIVKCRHSCLFWLVFSSSLLSYTVVLNIKSIRDQPFDLWVEWAQCLVLGGWPCICTKKLRNTFDHIRRLGKTFLPQSKVPGWYFSTLNLTDWLKLVSSHLRRQPEDVTEIIQFPTTKNFSFLLIWRQAARCQSSTLQKLDDSYKRDVEHNNQEPVSKEVSCNITEFITWTFQRNRKGVHLKAAALIRRSIDCWHELIYLCFGKEGKLRFLEGKGTSIYK